MLQVEFVALSQRTANVTYGETAEAIVRKLDQAFPDKVGSSHTRQDFIVSLARQYGGD